jgi:cobalamin biosynthesis Mg chelatase CobN
MPVRSVVPVMASDSNEMTAIDEKMMAKPLAIESQKPGRIGDDDPTMLSVREEERRGNSRSEKPSGKSRAIEAGSYPEGSGAREAPPTEKDPSKVQPVTSPGRSISAERISPKLPVIILVAMLVLAVAAAGLYFGGVLR